ncbi:DUF4265 domain-containing protein [Gryllotalpicola koreensis]|uniref:DUF4265 domain-containing protein n=1 Tax=Gryllotalpicola koreensis TaxID=993086 RepID=UPI003CD05C1E
MGGNAGAERVDDLAHELLYKCDLALGDVVEADAAFNINRVLRCSGRLVYRVAAVQEPSMRDDVVPELLRRGGLVERSSPGLVAVDAESKEGCRMDC